MKETCFIFDFIGLFSFIVVDFTMLNKNKKSAVFEINWNVVCKSYGMQKPFTDRVHFKYIKIASHIKLPFMLSKGLYKVSYKFYKSKKWQLLSLKVYL